MNYATNVQSATQTANLQLGNGSANGSRLKVIDEYQYWARLRLQARRDQRSTIADLCNREMAGLLPLAKPARP